MPTRMYCCFVFAVSNSFFVACGAGEVTSGDEPGGSSTCVDGPNGGKDCACYRNQTCNADLTCINGICVCPAGYAGDLCAQCADGYSRVETECIPNQKCSLTTCNGQGTCDDRSGLVVCTCTNDLDPDTLCAECLPGKQDSDDDRLCLPSCASADLDCTGNSACNDNSGVATCVCSWGYAGDNCDICASGYQDHNGDGICAPDCPTSSLDCGAFGTCNDTSGTTLCVCDTGYQDNDDNSTCTADCTTAALGCSMSTPTCSDEDGTAVCIETPPGQGGGGSGGGGTVGVFVAMGHAGRRVASCDGGDTWIADQSKDDAIRCWVDGDSNYVECDHNEWPGYGVQFGGGYFWVTYGWGQDGPKMRSANGVDWTTLNLVGQHGGLVYGEGTLLAASRGAKYSADLGDTWNDTDSVPLVGWVVRSAGYGGGTFYMAASSSNFGQEMVYSDDGLTWFTPDTVPATCGGLGTFAYGNGTMVWMGGDGKPCATSDNGRNWTQSTNDAGAPGAGASSIVFNGSEFVVWARGKVYRSASGGAWTSEDMNPNVSLAHVAAADDGSAYVGVKQGWGNYYGAQEFYYSTDAINWALASSFAGGHPIRSMTFGRAESSALCPDD